MEITSFINAEVLMTFTMTIVMVELWVAFTKEIKFIKQIPTRVYTLLMAIIHLLIINTGVSMFDWSVLGVYTLLCNGLIIAVILTGGYDIVTKKLTINGQGKENK